MENEKRKFIVGVIGTQNTGKSTFIKDLILEYGKIGYPFHQVGCDYRKKISEAGLKFNRNGDLRSQNIILDTLIEQLDIIKSSPDGNYITDRSPIDNYAYSVYLARHNVEAGITKYDLDDMFDRVKSRIVDYDRLIYIDLDKCENVKVVDDKFRDTNLEYRKEIDSIFKETFDLLGKEIVEPRLNREIYGTREERIAKFLWIEGKNVVK